ncbi:MAG: choice-of-anchor Q domain-containing protein [Planctomycetales bacterium]
MKISLQNNLIVSNRAEGVRTQLNTDDSGYLDLVYSNNTIASNGGAGISYSGTLPSFNAALRLIQNNIVVWNGQGLLTGAISNATNFVIRSNDVFGNGQDWANHPNVFGSRGQGHAANLPADVYSNISVDPLFVTQSDYLLSSASPAVNAGTKQDAPAFDIHGQRRGAKPDLGCDEVLVPPVIAPFVLLPDRLWRLIVEGEAGHVYRMESSSDLNVWITLGSAPNQNGTVEYTVPEDSSHRFFRVRLE